MDKSIRIAGFGFITVKQAFAEVRYYAGVMQEAYKAGELNNAIQAMRTMRPFVDALRKEGFTITQILPE